MDGTLFYIERQESLAQDKFNKNGRTLDLHVVAKNIAFVIHVAAAFDLNQSPPSAKLIYDLNDEEKDVEAMKTSPMEFIAHVDETGHKAAVEVKIGVLSSQHEGAYFRVKFTAVDPMSQTVLEEYSQPIKVMSKQNQVRKMMEKKTVKKIGENPASPNGDSAYIPQTPAKRTSSAVVNDSLLETLARMEEQQREQTKMIQQLMATQPRDAAYQPIREPVNIPDPDDMDFETAFMNFLNAYKKVPQQERANKMRKVIKLGGDAIENLSEISGLYTMATNSSSGIANDDFLLNNFEMLDSASHMESCKCDCPHKKQLARLDDFFQDFLADPLSPESL